MNALDQLIATAQQPPDEFVVFRGQLIKSTDSQRFIVNFDPSTNRDQAILQKEDVIDNVVKLTPDRLKPEETGYPIHEVKIRFGAHVTMLRTRKYRVGDPPATAPLVGDCSKSGAGLQLVNVTLKDALKAAPDRVCPDSVVLRGLILPANDPNSFVLQPDPSTRKDYAIINRRDVLNPNAIDLVPAFALAAHERGFSLAYVRIAYGSSIAVVRAASATVGKTKLWVSGGGSSCSCRGSGASGVAIPVTDSGDCDTTLNGNCPSGCSANTGGVCSAPGKSCKWGLFSGKCTTECHWIWGCACDCDLTA